MRASSVCLSGADGVQSLVGFVRSGFLHPLMLGKAAPMTSRTVIEAGFFLFGVLVCRGVANSIGADMPKGTVKWFNSQKGYGFIQPQGGSKDVFVHISAVERAGLSSLNEGQVIEYEEVSNRGKTSAENLRVQR
jgi:cold shock protein